MSADSDDALAEITCDSGMLLISDPMRIPAWVDLTEGVLADIGRDHRNDPPARVIELGSAWATIVWDIPRGPIRLTKRGEAAALKCVDLIFDEDEEHEPGEPMGVVGVDTGVIAVGDAHALGSWIADRPLDGLWDVTFWGIDQREAQSELGASDVEGGTIGWTDVSESEARSREQAIRTWLDGDPHRVLMYSVEPHSHDRLMGRQTLGSGAGSIEIAGQTVIGFLTSYGDGDYHLLGARGEDGRLRALRIELAEEWPPERITDVVARLR